MLTKSLVYVAILPSWNNALRTSVRMRPLALSGVYSAGSQVCSARDRWRLQYLFASTQSLEMREKADGDGTLVCSFAIDN